MSNVLIDLVAETRLKEQIIEKLGGFIPVFGEDIDNFATWGKYSRSLIEATIGYRLDGTTLPDDIQPYIPDGTEMETHYDEQAFGEIYYRTGKFTYDSVKNMNVPYHGLFHNLDVGNTNSVIDEKIEEITGLISPQAVKQLSQIGGATHDCFHHGESARKGERGEMHRPELGLDDKVTVEAVSALESVGFLASETAYSIPALWFVAALTNATHKNARPLSYHFAKIRMSDIAPTGNFVTEIDNTIILNYGRLKPELEVINGTTHPENIRDFPRKMDGFYYQVQKPEMDQFDQVTKRFVQNLDIPTKQKRKAVQILEKEPFTQLLGMRDKFKQQSADLAALQRGSGYHVGVLKTRLAEHELEVDSQGRIRA